MTKDSRDIFKPYTHDFFFISFVLSHKQKLPQNSEALSAEIEMSHDLIMPAGSQKKKITQTISVM